MSPHAKNARRPVSDAEDAVQETEGSDWLAERLTGAVKRATHERPDGTVICHKATVPNQASLRARLAADVRPTTLTDLDAALVAL